MSASLSGLPALPGMKGGRSLGSLAPLGRGGLEPLGGGGAGLNPLDKPKLGPLQGVGEESGGGKAGSLGRGAGSISSSSSPPIVPLRFALRYTPPTLAMEYEDRRDPQRPRRRLRLFVLTQVFPPSSLRADEGLSSASGRRLLERLVAQLSARFPQYLAPELVSRLQLTRLLRKALANYLDESDLSEHAGATPQQQQQQDLDGSMEEELEVSHGAQSGDEYAEERERELTPNARAAAGAGSNDGAEAGSAAGGSGEFFLPGADEDDGDDNLNRLSDEELARRKAEMNQDFEANQLRPGDPGYVYDKQIDFQPTEESEWD